MNCRHMHLLQYSALHLLVVLYTREISNNVTFSTRIEANVNVHHVKVLIRNNPHM